MGWDYDRNYRETRADKIKAAIVFTFAGACGLLWWAVMLTPLVRWIAGLVGWKF